MKTLKFLTLTVAAGSLLALTTAQAGILNTPHDFHAASWNSDPADPATVCSVCHTPHHADPIAGPLWNRTVATSGFTMYKGNAPAENLKSTPSSQPTGVSLACLSCHDGQTAINAYGGSSGTVGNTITNSANLTRDLSHSHPISLTYDTTLAGTGASQNKWLWNPDTTQVLQPDSGTFVQGNDMTIQGFLLAGNHRLECSSCHDVHNQEGTPYNLTSNPKLVKINGTQAGVGSLLCRSCHNK